MTSFPVKNDAWVLVKRPTGGDLTKEHLEYRSNEIAEIKDKQALLRVLSLSCDPTQRIWATDAKQYMEPAALNETMRAIGVAVVEESKSDAYKKGTVLYGLTGFTRYLVVDEAQAAAWAPVDLSKVSVNAALALFGAIGITAHHGVTKILKPEAGQTAVVTGAAGAVGSLVVQILKILGCRVIGIAGTAEKCKVLTEEFGADGAIDYKAENVGERLDALCPKGIDLLFENVGGSIMEAILDRMNNYGRVALCGLISTYQNNQGAGWGPSNFAMILMRRLTVQGFICLDHNNEAAEIMGDLGKWLGEGKLRFKVDQQAGIENCVEALGRLFSGSNIGKIIVSVSQL